MTKPRFQHDCSHCNSLGGYDYEGLAYDLYTCHQAIGGPTVIARWGDRGPDYTSGLAFGASIGTGQYSTPLEEAHSRAVIRGLLPPNTLAKGG